MRFAIAYCKDNTAGKNIVERFKELAFSPQIPVIELKKETVFSDDIDKEKYPELRGIDFLVFASTHKSSMKEPSLCLHAPGNWRSAELGGKDGKVCKTSALVLKYLFKKLEENWKADNKIKENYNLTLEATHHGPLIEIPCCFIEVGSSEKEWNDKGAVNVIAKTILSLKDYKADDWIPSIGVGGLHYAPVFNKIQLNSKYAIGHIIPKYILPLTSMMLSEAEKEMIEQIKEVVVDWKGCGNSAERKKVIDIIEGNGLKVVRSGGVEKCRP